MAPQRTDTAENPFGGRSYNAPSNMKRVGNGLRFVALAAAPTDLTDGVPTQDWKSVHVIFYGNETDYAGLTATFRPWRWYSKQEDGQSGATNLEVGRWIPDFEVTVALDPARITAAISSHLAWPTRDAEKMYWQLVGVWDAAGAAGVMPAFVYAQMFGDATSNDTIAVSVSSVGGGGGAVLLNQVYTQPAYIVNDQAVAVDPGVTYAPSVDGIVMDGYKDIAFEMYLLGGVGAAAANRTVTVVFQGSNDVEVPAGARQWVTLATGYDLGTDLTAASWASIGAVALVAQVDFDNYQHKRIRVMYDWDANPSVTNGIISITERRKA